MNLIRTCKINKATRKKQCTHVYEKEKQHHISLQIRKINYPFYYFAQQDPDIYLAQEIHETAANQPYSYLGG